MGIAQFMNVKYILVTALGGNGMLMKAASKIIFHILNKLKDKMLHDHSANSKLTANAIDSFKNTLFEHKTVIDNLNDEAKSEYRNSFKLQSMIKDSVILKVIENQSLLTLRKFVRTSKEHIAVTAEVKSTLDDMKRAFNGGKELLLELENASMKIKKHYATLRQSVLNIHKILRIEDNSKPLT
eukprot:TRINITY_DN15175_c0_g1_i4.p2 TRINITY_DN15175_c0_g1~~TRINITY_DN15175_c0_g1_i4.p2  ORF type:complete len:183 (+),score=18.58 TRINITY_DN15175_c0_g1_i4:38-586(+)